MSHDWIDGHASVLATGEHARHPRPALIARTQDV